MIIHQTVVHCDQNPLPLRCRRSLTIDFGEVMVDAVVEADVVNRLALQKDWGIENGRHYCPYHRPVR